MKDGAHYVTVLDVGARTPLFAAINRSACRRFPDTMLQAWTKHNIEEVGKLECPLPQLNSPSTDQPHQNDAAMIP